MWSSQSVIAISKGNTGRQRIGIPKKKTALNNFQLGLSFNFSGHVTFLVIFQALAHFYISLLPPFFYSTIVFSNCLSLTLALKPLEFTAHIKEQIIFLSSHCSLAKL